MFLYRGLKTSDYQPFDEEIEREISKSWEDILNLRANGIFNYPENLNSQIISLSKMIRLSDQYFTDRKEIAQGYAKNENGVLIEINPQIEEILKYFKVEFQDFGKRKDDFQLVYRVKGKDLCENKDRWGLKVKKFSKNDRISLNQELAP